MKIALTRTLPLLLTATAATISASPYPTLISRSYRVAFINSLSTATPSPSSSKPTPRMTMSSSSSPHWSPQQKQSLLSCPTIPLRDGTLHPSIGFGTYKVGFVPASASSAAAGASAGNNEPQRTAEECIRDALDIGYRFLEWYEYMYTKKLLFIVILTDSHFLLRVYWKKMLTPVRSFMVTRHKLARQSRPVAYRERNYSFAVRYGLQLLRREMMRYALSWIRVSYNHVFEEFITFLLTP